MPGRWWHSSASELRFTTRVALRCSWYKSRANPFCVWWRSRGEPENVISEPVKSAKMKKFLHTSFLGEKALYIECVAGLNANRWFLLVLYRCMKATLVSKLVELMTALSLSIYLMETLNLDLVFQHSAFLPLRNTIERWKGVAFLDTKNKIHSCFFYCCRLGNAAQLLPFVKCIQKGRVQNVRCVTVKLFSTLT